MNRYMSEPYSTALDAERQGEMMHRYILGVYDLYHRLTTEFPDVLLNPVPAVEPDMMRG